MFKENYYRAMGCFGLTSDFGGDRKTYIHIGIDWLSKTGKKQDIYNLVDGVLVFQGFGRDQGNHVILKHNPIYLNGANDFIYSSYYHLFEIDEIVKRKMKSKDRFFQSGNIIGKMGNTGYCLTKGKITNWRRVNENEIKNINSMAGVHLHQQFHQKAEPGEITAILKDMLDKNIIQSSKQDDYFYQWGNLYINPERFIDYLKLLQGRKI